MIGAAFIFGGGNMWLPEEMIPSYESSLASVRNAHHRAKSRPGEQGKFDTAQCNSMIADLSMTIRWLETGISPFEGGLQRMSHQRREQCAEEWQLDQQVAQTARQYMWQGENLDAKCKWNKAMLLLSDRERLAVVLVYGEGMTAVMAARIMQSADSTVRRYLLRARNKFKKLSH